MLLSQPLIEASVGLMSPDSRSPEVYGGRIAVVTAVAAGKDVLVDPVVGTENVDFIAFCDQPHDCLRVWQVRPLPIWSSDSRFASRRHAKLPKVLPQIMLPNYDYYIWIDGNYTLKMDPRDICAELLLDPLVDIAVFRHRLRTCIYSEAAEVLKYRLDHAAWVRKQMAAYRRQGYPKNAGLYELPAFVIRNSAAMLRLSLAWWEQICRYSSRDQLSFPIAAQRTGARVSIIKAPSVHDNPYLGRVHHHRYPHAIMPARHRLAAAIRRCIKRAINWDSCKSVKGSKVSRRSDDSGSTMSDA